MVARHRHRDARHDLGDIEARRGQVTAQEAFTVAFQATHLPDPIEWPRSLSGIALPTAWSPVEFDEERHRYILDGEVIPGVTTVIKGLVDYSMIPPMQLDWAAKRGTAAHYATELFDADDLDLDALDPRLTPYVHAWMLFREQSGWVSTGSEQRVYHPLYNYCGTFDRVGSLPGLREGILDIKTTTTVYLDYCATQTIAYLRAWNHDRAKADQAKRRYVVQLRVNGTYRLVEFEDHAADWQRFRTHLNRYTGEVK